MTQLKPHLACDVAFDKLKFPLIGMPKLDGVRGINLNGTITGRSLKEFKNKFVTARFSGDFLKGCDGELCLGSITAPRLCSETTGFVNRKTPKPGKPTESDELVWWLFDYIADDFTDKPYVDRLLALSDLVADINGNGNYTVKLVPYRWIHNLEELETFDDWCLEQGYEGSIYRDPDQPHKSGRATTKAGAYLRLKRFIDFEGVIENLIEAMENANEAKTNELGRTERSTHQENMIPKGMVGMIQKRSIADVIHNGKVLIQKDQLVDVGPGNMDHAQRIHYWNNPIELIGQIGKSKFFPHGQKDKPRFPTFIGLRAEEDMSD